MSDYAELERLARAARDAAVSPVYSEDQYDKQTYADRLFRAAASPDVVLRLLARRAPGDRDRLREAAQAAASFLEQTSWEDAHDERGAWAVLDELKGALAADSRPEQPAPNRDLQEWAEEAVALAVGAERERVRAAVEALPPYTRHDGELLPPLALGRLEVLAAIRAVRPEEPPE